MKKTAALSAAGVWTIAGLADGVFYREFTRFNDFTGVTVLASVHAHMLILGSAFFLFILVADRLFGIAGDRRFPVFFAVYNAGLALSMVLMIIRGIFQVLDSPVSPGISAMVAGIAGIGHILVAVGMIQLWLILRRCLSPRS